MPKSQTIADIGDQKVQTRRKEGKYLLILTFFLQ